MLRGPEAGVGAAVGLGAEVVESSPLPLNLEVGAGVDLGAGDKLVAIAASLNS